MFEDLKFKIQKGDALIRIIMLNIFIFVLLLVLKVLLILTLHEPTWVFLKSFFELPMSMEALIYKPWTIFTYGFTHFEIFHFIFNMLGLYWFGSIIQDFIGEKRLVAIFLYGILIGAVLVLFSVNVLPFFKNEYRPLVGASAGIYALSVAAVTLLPTYTISFPIFGEVRLLYLVLIYLVISFASTIGSNGGGNIAHLGGAFAGFVFNKTLQKGLDLGLPFYKFSEFIMSLFVKKSKLKVVYRNPSLVMKESTDLSDQDEIDRILDKMNQNGGYNSLTKEEKEKLFKYSQK